MSKTTEIRHFTNLPHVWWGARTPAGQKRYDNKAALFKKRIKQKKAIKILEVGCGDGEFTKRLIRVVNHKCKIVAMDITPILIKRANELIKDKRATFKIDDIESMAFPDKTFDIVCGISILHHVDIDKALREIYRVLKKGGEIFFTEPNYLNPHIFLGLHIKPSREKMEFSPNETAFKRWGLERIIKHIGFIDIEVKNYDFLHPYTPKPLIDIVEKISQVAEKIPLVKEISGSLMVYAKK